MHAALEVGVGCGVWVKGCGLGGRGSAKSDGKLKIQVTSIRKAKSGRGLLNFSKYIRNKDAEIQKDHQYRARFNPKHAFWQALRELILPSLPRQQGDWLVDGNKNHPLFRNLTGALVTTGG